VDGALLLVVGVAATGSAIPTFILASSLLHFLDTDTRARSRIWLFLAALLSFPFFSLTVFLVTGYTIGFVGPGWLLFSVVAIPFATGFLIVGRGLHRFGKKDGFAIAASVAAAAIFCGYIFTR
jgi:hypothetical protein